MKKPIFEHLILFNLFLKQFRLAASTVSWSKLFHRPMSMTRFEKKYIYHELALNEDKNGDFSSLRRNISETVENMV